MNINISLLYYQMGFCVFLWSMVSYAQVLQIRETFPDLDVPLHAKDNIPESDGGGPFSRIDLSLPHNWQTCKKKLPLVIYFSGGSGAVRGTNPFLWNKPVQEAGFPNFSYYGKGYPTMCMSTYKTQKTMGIEVHDGETNARNWNKMLDRLATKYAYLPIDWQKIIVIGYSNGGRAIFAVASDTTSSPTAEQETSKFLNRVVGIFVADGSQLTGTGIKRIIERKIPVGLVNLVDGNFMNSLGIALSSWYGGTKVKIWDGNGPLNNHGLYTFDRSLSPELRKFLEEMVENSQVDNGSPATVMLESLPTSALVDQILPITVYADAYNFDQPFAKILVFVKHNNTQKIIATLIQNMGKTSFTPNTPGTYTFYAIAYYGKDVWFPVSSSEIKVDVKTSMSPPNPPNTPPNNPPGNPPSNPPANPPNKPILVVDKSSSTILGEPIGFTIANVSTSYQGKTYSKWSLYQLNERGGIQKHIKTVIRMDDKISWNPPASGQYVLRAIVTYGSGSNMERFILPDVTILVR